MGNKNLRKQKARLESRINAGPHGQQGKMFFRKPGSIKKKSK